MYKKDKRGISPIIATVLLITIALALAAIIFIWAKTFFGEKITKDGSDINAACEQASFSAEISPTKLMIENQGNIALYGVKIDKVEGGSVSEFQTISPRAVPGGQSAEITLSSGLYTGDSVVVVPILLGEDSNGERVPFTCDSSSGASLSVAE